MNKNKLEERLNKNIEKIIFLLEKNNVIELMEILGNNRKMIIRNFFAGISKGIGVGIGFTLLTAILVIILQKIVTLNIPIIGDYISDIIDIVQAK